MNTRTPPTAGDVKRIGYTGQGIVADAERGRADLKLDVFALHEEALPEGAGGNCALLAAADRASRQHEREPTALACGGCPGVCSTRHQDERQHKEHRYPDVPARAVNIDRKRPRLNSSHDQIS